MRNAGIGRPETVDAAIALSNPEPAMPDWMTLIRRINGFRNRLTREAFGAIRERFGTSLNAMSDRQLWELLQELEAILPV